MSKKQPYDPEDIESLMMHKSFNELYPEEKAFVLRHIESEHEYEHMRKTLQAIVSGSDSEPMLKAPSRIKKNLMAEFAGERKSGWIVWLNTFKAWVWPEDVWLALRPALIVPVVVLCGVMAWWYMADTGDASLLAEVKEQPKVTERSMPVEDNTENVNDLSSADRPNPEDLNATVQDDLETATMEDANGRDEITVTTEALAEAVPEFRADEDLAKDENNIDKEKSKAFEPPTSNTVPEALDLTADEIQPATEESVGTVTLHTAPVMTDASISKLSSMDIQEVTVASESRSRVGTNLFQNTNPMESVQRQNAQKDKAVLGLLYTAY